MRQGFRTGILVLYNVLWIVAALGTAEYVARRTGFGTFSPRDTRPETLRDRYAGFRNNPGFANRYTRHNAQGFRRDSDISVAKPAGTVRIFLLGGSVTYGGEGLYGEIESAPPPTNAETIDHYLEERLRRELPGRNWEVVNAGVKGYLLHQDLGLLLSVVLRYKPDYVVSIDGVNDISALLRAPMEYDPYLLPEELSDFDHLANPQSLGSVRLFVSAMLRNNSAFYRGLQDAMTDRIHRWRRAKVLTGAYGQTGPVRFEDLNRMSQEQYRVTAAQLGTYLHTVRQMHQVLALDGIRDLFVLQPELVLSRKTRTSRERELEDFHHKVESRLFVYGFQSLYPQLGDLLKADALRQGYRFLNLSDAFDTFEQQAFTDYCHLTPAADRLVADRIFAELAPSLTGQK